jgi:hypothetical protein
MKFVFPLSSFTQLTSGAPLIGWVTEKAIDPVSLRIMDADRITFPGSGMSCSDMHAEMRSKEPGVQTSPMRLASITRYSTPSGTFFSWACAWPIIF